MGFEVAEKLCELPSEQGVDVVNAMFTNESLNLIPADFRKAQLLVLLYTFHYLYDCASFFDTVKKVLDLKRGVFLLEAHNLDDIYRKHETAIFGHEHATYLHFCSMSIFLKRHGLRVIDFNFVPKKACRDSLMIVIATVEGSELKSAPNLSSFENPELNNLQTFLKF